MEVAAVSRSATGLSSIRALEQPSFSTSVRHVSTPVLQSSRGCFTESNGRALLGGTSRLQSKRNLVSEEQQNRHGVRRRNSPARRTSLVRSQMSDGVNTFSSEQTVCSSKDVAGDNSRSASSLETPSVSPATLAQLPTPLLLLALRFPVCQKALSQITRLSSSSLAAAKLALWFVSGKYIPSERRVLFTLARGYRRHVRNFDGPQLLHDLNFLPEIPDLTNLFPALTWAVILSHAVVSSLGSVGFAQWGAAVPGLPECAPPVVGHRVSESGFIDKSDQPETPGYHPLGEWVGPRGLKPWERNAVTIDQEKRDEYWQKNMNNATLNPFNSTRKERKILLALAFISSSLTNMWILLHAMFVPLIFLWFMMSIEKPFFWVLSQVYKLRKLVVTNYKGPLA